MLYCVISFMNVKFPEETAHQRFPEGGSGSEWERGWTEMASRDLFEVIGLPDVSWEVRITPGENHCLFSAPYVPCSVPRAWGYNHSIYPWMWESKGKKLVRKFNIKCVVCVFGGEWDGGAMRKNQRTHSIERDPTWRLEGQYELGRRWTIERQSRWISTETQRHLWKCCCLESRETEKVHFCWRIWKRAVAGDKAAEVAVRSQVLWQVSTSLLEWPQVTMIF